MLTHHAWSSLCLAPLLFDLTLGHPVQKPLSAPLHTPATLNYTGFELRRYGISSREDLIHMIDMVNKDNIDIWQLTPSHVDIHMDTSNLPDVLASRTYTTLPYSFPYSHSYAAPNNGSIVTPPPLPDVSSLQNNTFHTAYHTFQEIDLFVVALATTYPGLVEVVRLGESWENQEVFALRIGNRGGGKHKKGEKGKKDKKEKHGKGKGPHGKAKKLRGLKADRTWTIRARDSLQDMYHSVKSFVAWNSQMPSSIRDIYVNSGPDDHTQAHGLKTRIVIQGAQHAREWIATSTALYLAHALVVPEKEPGSLQHLLDNFDFTIIPVPNPDGYSYTWTTDRLWYKNRMDVGPGAPDSNDCKGIDMNRNWGYQWNSTGGNSLDDLNDPCSHWFPGAYPFQAPEVTAIANYVRRTPKIRAFIDLRSYGQKLMYPYSFSCDQVPPHAEDIIEAALGATKALRETHGVPYTSGASCELLYPAPGNIIDWTYGDAKVKYSYSLMLRDTGTYGFLLPPRWIQPVGEETAAAVKSLARFMETV